MAFAQKVVSLNSFPTKLEILGPIDTEIISSKFDKIEVNGDESINLNKLSIEESENDLRLIILPEKKNFWKKKQSKVNVWVYLSNVDVLTSLTISSSSSLHIEYNKH